MSINERILRALQVMDTETLTGGRARTLHTPFGEQVMASRQQDVHIVSSHGISSLRDTCTEQNGATITSEGGEYRLRTGGTAGAFAQLQSNSRASYIAGTLGQVGVGARIPQALTGDQEARWGLFDDNNGFGFGINSTGVFVWYQTDGGSIQRIPRAQWNIDKMDGNGPSGTTDAEWEEIKRKGVIWQIDWTWYGYGTIVMSLVSGRDLANATRSRTPIHAINFDGLSIRNPDQHLTAVIDDGTTGSDVSLYIAGRQFSFYSGSPRHIARSFGEVAYNVSCPANTWTPLLAIKHDPDFRGTGLPSTARVFTRGFGALSDKDVEFRKVYGGNVAGGTFNAITFVEANESVCVANTSITGFSGGTTIARKIAESAKGADFSPAELEVEQELGDETTFTLLARPLGGTTATVTALLRWEEWW